MGLMPIVRDTREFRNIHNEFLGRNSYLREERLQEFECGNKMVFDFLKTWAGENTAQQYELAINCGTLTHKLLSKAGMVPFVDYDAKIKFENDLRSGETNFRKIEKQARRDKNDILIDNYILEYSRPHFDTDSIIFNSGLVVYGMVREQALMNIQSPVKKSKSYSLSPLERLESELEKEIAKENYEKCAELRDQIRKYGS